MRIFILGVIISAFSSNWAFSEKVSVTDASLVAKNYYFQKSGNKNNIKYSQLSMQLSYVGVNILDTVYYAFSDFDNSGYVIISADNNVKPILAYSNQTVFSGDNIPEACLYLLDSYSEQIIFTRHSTYIPDSNISLEWNKLASLTAQELKITETPSTPLILSHWSQGSPYNEYCPEDSDGPGGHTLVGCVAIAMAQVMKYYNYPAQGTGTHSYYAPGYGNQSVNFGNSNYEFYNMPFVGSDYNSNLAEFLYHCGVGSEMNYGPDGSGAWVSTACESMEANFNYSSNWEYDSRNQYSDSQWKALIKNEIDNLRPMIYVGYTNSSGHAWNCDGYQNDLFHMNWGWGGSYDGFFNIDNLVAGGYNFYTGHKIAYNLYPGENYPEHCGNITDIWGTEGSFDDGSGPQKYNNNIDCFWQLVPECGQNIYIEFDFFDVKPGDTLYIYDGMTLQSPVLAKLTGEDLIPGSIFSDKGGVLINFVTNGDSIASGWTISYTVDFCEGSRNLTQIIGTLNDGSGECNYKDASMCNWTINPPNTDSVLIHFTEFDLFQDIDNVKIFDGSINSDNMIAKYTSGNIPQDIMVYSDKVIVYFFTNGTGNGNGWTLDYTAYTNPDGISDIQSDEMFSLFPNPANDEVNICLKEISSDNPSLKIFSSLGENIYSVELNSSVEKNLNINCSQYPSGVYYVIYSTGNNRYTRKFVRN